MQHALSSAGFNFLNNIHTPCKRVEMVFWYCDSVWESLRWLEGQAVGYSVVGWFHHWQLYKFVKRTTSTYLMQLKWNFTLESACVEDTFFMRSGPRITWFYYTSRDLFTI